MPEEHWTVGYRKALLGYLAKHADVRTDRPSKFGWRLWGREADNIRRHLNTCGVNPDRSGTVEDVTWTEFEGTFCEDSHHYGVDALLSCNCGKMKDAPYRIETGLSSILKGILAEE